MECIMSAGMVKLRGELIETTQLDPLKERFRQLQDSHAEIIVDFSELERANSLGLKGWLDFIDAVPNPLAYAHCPSWLVRQFGMINGFLPEKVRVLSFEAPFQHEESGEIHMVLYEVGKTLLLLDDYANFTPEPVVVEGKTFVHAFLPEDYLDFLVELKARSRRAKMAS